MKIHLKTFVSGQVTVLFALVCFALSPQARASCQQGCDISHGGTFLGDDALVHNSFGAFNTAIGQDALQFNTTGERNTAIGSGALIANGTGNANTAVGVSALYENTGDNNTAIGCFTLTLNTGFSNTASGEEALYSNRTGNSNTATGFKALFSNTTGSFNTANGVNALLNNTTGNTNTANGYFALYSNTTGYGNTVNGAAALYANTTGFYNTANGDVALSHNTTGNYNTATGYLALHSNATGANNTAVGSFALNSDTGSGNTAIGFNSLFGNTTGINNVALGFRAGFSLTSGSGNVCIGYNVVGVGGESDTTRIRNVYSSVASGRAVYVNSDNKIGTLASTRRVKENIKPMDGASEAILALKPVSFRYKKEIDASGTSQFGLIAEDVAETDPELVTRDAQGKPETVRYEAVNAMLLNEFLKEHRQVQEQKTTITELKSAMTQQQKQIAALTAGLQKVSAQLELSKAAPQMVKNSK